MIAASTRWSVTVPDIQELSRNNIKYQVKSCSGKHLARLRNKTSHNGLWTHRSIFVEVNKNLNRKLLTWLKRGITWLTKLRFRVCIWLVRSGTNFWINHSKAKTSPRYIIQRSKVQLDFNFFLILCRTPLSGEKRQCTRASLDDDDAGKTGGEYRRRAEKRSGPARVHHQQTTRGMERRGAEGGQGIREEETTASRGSREVPEITGDWAKEVTERNHWCHSLVWRETQSAISEESQNRNGYLPGWFSCHDKSFFIYVFRHGFSILLEWGTHN